jgi:hypothetical protein
MEPQGAAHYGGVVNHRSRRHLLNNVAYYGEKWMGRYPIKAERNVKGSEGRYSSIDDEIAAF